MTSNKKNLKTITGTNQGQGQINKERGNSAMLYITIIDFLKVSHISNFDNVDGRAVIH